MWPVLTSRDRTTARTIYSAVTPVVLHIMHNHLLCPSALISHRNTCRAYRWCTQSYIKWTPTNFSFLLLDNSNSKRIISPAWWCVLMVEQWYCLSKTIRWLSHVKHINHHLWAGSVTNSDTLRWTVTRKASYLCLVFFHKCNDYNKIYTSYLLPSMCNFTN